MLLINYRAVNTMLGTLAMGKLLMKMKPPIFKGSGSELIRNWIYQFKQAAQLKCWNNAMA